MMPPMGGRPPNRGDGPVPSRGGPDGGAIDVGYAPLRAVLEARCRDEGWSTDPWVDPHDWQHARISRRTRHRPGREQGFGRVISKLLVLLIGCVAMLKDREWGEAALSLFVLGVVVALAGSVGLPGGWGGLRFLHRARRVAGRGAGMPAQYLLTRDGDGRDWLLLFTATWQWAPFGAVELELPAAGVIPPAGGVWLASGLDPAVGLPADGETVVPIVRSGALWPATGFRALRGWSPGDARELMALVTGRGVATEQDRGPAPETPPARPG